MAAELEEEEEPPFSADVDDEGKGAVTSPVHEEQSAMRSSLQIHKSNSYLPGQNAIQCKFRFLHS